MGDGVGGINFGGGTGGFYCGGIGGLGGITGGLGGH